MTKRQAQLIRTLVQCYRDSRDDRLLEAIELVVEEKLTYEIPPLYFFDSEGDCIASTSRVSHTAPRVIKNNAVADTTNLESPDSGVSDSSGAVSYCDSANDKEDVDGPKHDENN